LAAWLDCVDPDLRLEAVRLLTSASDDSAPHFDAMVARLVDRNDHVAQEAEEAIAAMGAPGAVCFARRLGSPSVELRCLCALALARMGELALPHLDSLVDRLQDSELAVQETAARALAPPPCGIEWGIAAVASASVAATVARRLECFGQSDAMARRRVEEVLAKLGPDGWLAFMPHLESSPRPCVRRHAANALGRICPAAAAAESHLRAAVQLEQRAARAKVAAALGGRLARDGDQAVRRAAAEALGRLGGGLSTRAAEACRLVPHPDVQGLAQRLLARRPASAWARSDAGVGAEARASEDILDQLHCIRQKCADRQEALTAAWDTTRTEGVALFKPRPFGLLSSPGSEQVAVAA